MSNYNVELYANFISKQNGQILNENTEDDRLKQIHDLMAHHLQHADGHQTAAEEHQLAGEAHEAVVDHLSAAKKVAHDPEKFAKAMEKVKKAAKKADEHTKSAAQPVTKYNDDHDWNESAKDY
jgi:hypothetical protein